MRFGRNITTADYIDTTGRRITTTQQEPGQIAVAGGEETGGTYAQSVSFCAISVQSNSLKLSIYSVAICRRSCRNGGTCYRPNTCRCRSAYYGEHSYCSYSEIVSVDIDCKETDGSSLFSMPNYSPLCSAAVYESD